MGASLNLQATVELDYHGNVSHIFVHDGEGCCDTSISISIGRQDITVRTWADRYPEED